MTIRPCVLFICVSNSGKSQMAAALARKHASGSLEVQSAGTHPGLRLNEQSVTAIAEVGADMSADHPKGVDPALLRRADRVIVVGAQAQLELPDDASGSIEYWLTEEPSARGVEGKARMRLIRDEIDDRVQLLITDLMGKHS